MSTKKSETTFLTTILKFSGFAGLTSAAMGLPAVYLLFSKFGIPTYYIDYHVILSAGIFPTIFVIAATIYFRAILAEAKAAKGTVKSIAAGIPMLLFFPLLPIIILSFISICIFSIWYALTLLLKIWDTHWLYNLQRLEIATILFVIGCILWAAYIIASIYKPELAAFKFINRIIGLKLPKKIITDAHKGQTNSSDTNIQEPFRATTNSNISDESIKKSDLLAVLSMWVILPVLFIIVIFSSESLLYIWNPKITGLISPGTDIWIGIGLGFIYALAFSSLFWVGLIDSKNTRKKYIGVTLAALSLIVIGIYSISVYSIKIFPVLPQAWGGGRREIVAVWIDKDSLPPLLKMQTLLPGIIPKPENKLVELEGAPSLSVDNYLILLGEHGKHTKGIALPKQNIKMVAWTPAHDYKSSKNNSIFSHICDWIDDQNLKESK